MRYIRFLIILICPTLFINMAYAEYDGIDQYVFGNSCSHPMEHLFSNIIVGGEKYEMMINQNQIYITAKAYHHGDKIDIYLVDPSDLGEGGNNLNWRDFDRDKMIAYLVFLRKDIWGFKWLGFFDKDKNNYTWTKNPDFMSGLVDRDGYINLKKCVH